MRRVVVTGMGMVTPLGNDPAAAFQEVLDGRSGVVRMRAFDDIGDLGARIAAPVRGFEPDRIPRKHRRSMARMAQYAANATADALESAHFPMDTLGSGRVAVCAGSTTGSPDAMEEFWREYITNGSIRAIPSTSFLRVMSHTVASHIALAFGITGSVISPSCACAASNQAVGLATDLIRFGRADSAIAGGADELSILSAATFDVVRAGCRGHEDAPHTRPAPFDRTRDGVVCSEGAAIVVLEELEQARARGAPILAEILGYGESCDATHMSSPQADGMASAIERALADAKLTPADIDYVCAHATGTPVGDAAEAEATYRIFGSNVPVSSLKGHLGHMLAACGSTELILCIEAMRRGVVPPTLNLTDPDVSPLLLPQVPLERRLRRVVSNNFAFGGINASLVVGAAPDPRA
ncbi:MAG: beta-ketoacyl-[acyl-carrier-protein] synthase family protein [Pseudomonadota bacterium]|nr:beta-ketoacyl-[acyl-carrier-protein] synthase family protein [Pseudomonadota bacterium]